MTDIDGNALSMSGTFGSSGFGTLEPGNGTLEEQIVFTGLVNNANGTTTLSGVSSVSFVYPYTQTSGLAKTHAGSVTFVISNTSGFYDKLTSKSDDETITGTWTFPSTDPNRAGIGSDTDTAVATAFVTLGQLSRQAIAGAANASTTVKGLVQLPTQAQTDARTTIGSTGAALVLTPDVVRSTKLSDTVDDSGSGNTYAITPVPAVAAYSTGIVVGFRATHTNTGAATLNVNGLGARTITKEGTTALASSDIIAGLFVQAEYGNGAGGFQMMNPVANPPLTSAAFNAAVKFGGTGADGALTVSSGTTTIDLGGLKYVVKNYSSIAITGTGKVTFSNAHANGTLIVLKSQGAVTLTSSQTPMLDGVGFGASGGAGSTNSSGNNATGANGSAGLGVVYQTNFGTGSTGAGVGTGGALPTFALFTSLTHPAFIKYGSVDGVGSGGGGGGVSGGGNSRVGTSGNGGNGGASIIIECNGAWNFTTANGVSVAGAGGTAGTNTSGAGGSIGGGGGGAGGFFLALYNTLTANSGTVVVSGGAGSAGVIANGAACGGGGGASILNTGANGSTTTGGDGGAGFSLIAANTEFA